MSYPSFQNSAILDEDAKTFLSNPKNKKHASKKKQTDNDDVSVMTDSATVGGQNKEEDI